MKKIKALAELTTRVDELEEIAWYIVGAFAVLAAVNMLQTRAIAKLEEREFDTHVQLDFLRRQVFRLTPQDVHETTPTE